MRGRAALSAATTLLEHVRDEELYWIVPFSLIECGFIAFSSTTHTVKFSSIHLFTALYGAGSGEAKLVKLP